MYVSVQAYTEARIACPQCQHATPERLISQVHFAAPSRDYTRLSSGEMLSVLESGDKKQVDQLFRQVGDGRLSPDQAPVIKPASDAPEH